MGGFDDGTAETRPPGGGSAGDAVHKHPPSNGIGPDDPEEALAAALRGILHRPA